MDITELAEDRALPVDVPEVPDIFEFTDWLSLISSSSSVSVLAIYLNASLKVSFDATEYPAIFANELMNLLYWFIFPLELSLTINFGI